MLFVVGGLAGWLAAKLFRSGSPPTPDLAIDEAKRIRETVEGSVSGEPRPPETPVGGGEV